MAEKLKVGAGTSRKASVAGICSSGHSKIAFYDAEECPLCQEQYAGGALELSIDSLELEIRSLREEISTLQLQLDEETWANDREETL